MKDNEKIFKDNRILTFKESELMDGTKAYNGILQLHTGKRNNFTWIMSTDGGWEHISVSIAGSNTKMPSWEEMCEVKSIFWDSEEEVHQIHPKESEYVHSVRTKKNVMHLWRPVNGWMETERS